MIPWEETGVVAPQRSGNFEIIRCLEDLDHAGFRIVTDGNGFGIFVMKGEECVATPMDLAFAGGLWISHCRRKLGIYS